MRAACVLAALGFAAMSAAQAVPVGIAPDEDAPDGCDTTAKGNFTIGYEPAPSRKRETAAEADSSALVCNLEDGVLRDPDNRIGSIVANRQFQFDGPPQAGAIYTGGFSVCDNSSLALGGSTRWWKCGSGNFFNLYDQWIGDQCDEIRIVIAYVDQPKSSSSSSVASSTATPTATGSGTSSSATLSATPLTSINGTMTTGLSTASRFTSAPASGSNSPSSSSGSSPTETTTSGGAQSTGAAVPTRVPRRETFGAVVGILGAAMLL